MAALWAIVLSLLSPGTAFADVDVDIRAVGALIAGSSDASYAIRIADCQQLASLDISGGSEVVSLGPQDASSTSGLGCEFTASLSGPSVLSPSAVLHLSDGTTQSYAETFLVEANAPSISFQSAGIGQLDGKQYLDVPP